jgi:hypothetical protein
MDLSGAWLHMDDRRNYPTTRPGNVIGWSSSRPGFSWGLTVPARAPGQPPVAGPQPLIAGRHGHVAAAMPGRVLYAPIEQRRLARGG